MSDDLVQRLHMALVLSSVGQRVMSVLTRSGDSGVRKHILSHGCVAYRSTLVFLVDRKLKKDVPTAVCLLLTAARQAGAQCVTHQLAEATHSASYL